MPELQRLYHSTCAFSAVEGRMLLLRMVSQGVHTEADFQMIHRNALPTLVMGMLHSPTVALPLQVSVPTLYYTILLCNWNNDRSI